MRDFNHRRMGSFRLWRFKRNLSPEFSSNVLIYSSTVARRLINQVFIGIYEASKTKAKKWHKPNNGTC
jgi:hypothetical protein